MYSDLPTMMAQLQRNRYWYLGFGIAMVVFGTLAILFSYTTTIFSVLYLASMLCVIGVVEFLQAFKTQFWKRFFVHLILALLYIASGVFIYMNPLLNAITLTLLLAAFFVASGVLKIVVALSRNVPHSGWVIANGVLSVILGVLIWMQWPVSGLWVIGLFVGIDALLTGWSWIVLALAVPKKSIE